MYEWKNTDPRIDINKRADIIILRSDTFEISRAHVDTKEVYCIFTDFSDFRCIGEDKIWDTDWKWIYAPSFGKYEWDNWKNSDPRFDIKDNKNIIIVAPWFGVGIGTVDVTNGWNISTSFESYKNLTVDDEWNQDWWWIFGPQN